LLWWSLKLTSHSDKKSAQHFTLVHRPQNDPLIHDEDAPSMVLNPTNTKTGPSQVKHLDDLASEFGSEAAEIRANEGEAAAYGVYYDDTEYDYMQHLRDLGSGSGEVVFVESNAAGNKGKGKQKQSLEDALKDLDLERGSTTSDQLDEDLLPSKNLTRLTYEAQQEVPDSIAGLQPDMDPRLREVLEALEDEAYVEDDDDIFKELAKDGHELDDNEFDETWDDDDGWESDDTAKPNKEYKDEVPDLVPVQGEQPEVGPSQDWLEDFKKFKQEQKGGRVAAVPSHSEMQSNWTMTTNGGRRKKRKGAMTNPSSYSMTSSALSRTDQLSLLDARFDVLEEKYNEDMSEMGSVSALSTASSVTGPTRQDFDSVMDEFLGNYTKPGKRTNKKNRAQTGLQQLDEIRQGLGPARFRSLGTKTQ
jgi:protein LTV1